MPVPIPDALLILVDGCLQPFDISVQNLHSLLILLVKQILIVGAFPSNIIAQVISGQEWIVGGVSGNIKPSPLFLQSPKLLFVLLIILLLLIFGIIPLPVVVLLLRSPLIVVVRNSSVLILQT